MRVPPFGTLPSLVFGTNDEFARHLSSINLAHKHYHSELLKGRYGVLMGEWVVLL